MEELNDYIEIKKNNEHGEYDDIPDRTLVSLENYVKHQGSPGGFLKAVLSNDLTKSFGRADLDNRAALYQLSKFIYNQIPAKCWGSTKKVKDWLGQ